MRIVGGCDVEEGGDAPPQKLGGGSDTRRWPWTYLDLEDLKV